LEGELLAGCLRIESASTIDILLMLDWLEFELIILFLYIIQSKFLFITHSLFMIHRRIELLPNRQKQKDTLWNLSELLGTKAIATPENIINQRMFPERTNRLIKTPDLSAKK
jgi:hypothetical protein